jgi:hypothetical protein
MAKKEKTVLTKQNWVQNFNLVGKVKLSDYTFKLDEKSERSDWIYNSMNLGIDAGEHFGVCYCETMGGYGSERANNYLFVHGKKEDGSDDFSNSYQIDWSDRENPSILEDIGSLCFMTAGLEVDSNSKTFYKKFLSPYDFIAYCAENLKEDMVVNVRGQLKYTVYNGNIQCRKEINSIALSSATPDKYRATFTQTMLLDRDSVTKDSIDKDKGVINVSAYVLEKFKEYNGWDLTDGGKVKGGAFVPLHKNFEYEINPEKPELTTAVINKLFKVKKGVTQITWEGEMIESGATVTATLDDLTDDIKELIELGLYTEEEALAKCTVGGSKERRMILKKPAIKMVGDDEDKVPQIQRFEEAFTEEDMQLECLIPKETDEEEEEPDDFDKLINEDNGSESTVDEDDELQALLNALD